MSNVKIIKLGGSVLSYEGCVFDFAYLKQFREIVLKRVAQGEKFCIITGGGYTCRMYLNLAKESGLINDDLQLHWIGTTVNVLHAELVRSIFGDMAYERPCIYEQYYLDEKIDMSRPILLGGGGRPGHSGDMDAVLLARKTDADTIISLKNVDYLYNADPKIHENAIKVERTTWKGYMDIIGNIKVHKPGGNYVVDPASALEAEKYNLKFVVMQGRNLENFDAYLSGKSFKGSIIE